MTKALPARYQDRMKRVLDHIDRNLDGHLDLASLSGVAAFSKHHFHRQFAAIFGIPLYRYVQLTRLKRASYRLAFRQWETITEIAMDAGYEAPDAFSRAFRNRFGQRPSDFQRTPDWQPWLEAFGPLSEARTLTMQRFGKTDVTIVDLPVIPVAVMEHRGDPASLGETIRRFIAWRRRTGVRAPASRTFTIFHADPDVTPPADYRIGLCAGTDRPLGAGDADEGVRPGVIPAGRSARLRVLGSSDDLRPAALFLYREWLPASGEEPRDFPLYAERVRFFPDVPEHEAITDLFLPLR